MLVAVALIGPGLGINGNPLCHDVILYDSRAFMETPRLALDDGKLVITLVVDQELEGSINELLVKGFCIDICRSLVLDR